MKPFRFKNFSVAQSEKVFRVGTDAVLLGAICACEKAKNVLEIGCGTGVISMMIAQRNPEANILGIDINEDAAALSALNFADSPFKNRLRAESADVRDFCTSQKFDLIISNPPYFKENISVKDKLARQQTELDFGELISAAAKNLTTEGIFSVIIPSDSADDFIKTCQSRKLYLARKINVFGIKHGIPKRAILEFSFEQNGAREHDFTIEKSPRKYSYQYLELTKDFHVFGG